MEVLNVLVLLCILSAVNGRVVNEANRESRRGWHGCPFMFPCPPPPCDNPVYGPHDCCGHCPDPAPEPEVTPQQEKELVPKAACTNPCRYGNQTFCGHIPCPLPRCDRPLVLTPGDCCQHCPTPTPSTTTPGCPFPCTQGGHHFCVPPPCPLPPCANRVLAKGACCEHCPDGPTCRSHGQILKVGEQVSTSSQICTCKHGGPSDGVVECIYV